QPTDAISGFAFYPSVTVQVKDQYGNAVPTNGVTVSMSVVSGSCVLTGGTSTGSGNDGVALFDSLVPNGSSGVVALSASATGLGSVTSASFNLTGVDVDELDFVVQPTNNVAGVTLGEVQVIAYSSGNPVPQAAITLSLA